MRIQFCLALVYILVGGFLFHKIQGHELEIILNDLRVTATMLSLLLLAGLIGLAVLILRSAWQISPATRMAAKLARVNNRGDVLTETEKEQIKVYVASGLLEYAGLAYRTSLGEGQAFIPVLRVKDDARCH